MLKLMCNVLVVRALPHGRQPAVPCRLWLDIGLTVPGRRVPADRTIRLAQSSKGKVPGSRGWAG